MAAAHATFTSRQHACASPLVRWLTPVFTLPPQVHTTPLVGVWVKGPDTPLHPLVAAAALKFYYASTLLDRALQEGGSFLLLLCPEGAAWAGVCGGLGGWVQCHRVPTPKAMDAHCPSAAMPTHPPPRACRPQASL